MAWLRSPFALGNSPSRRPPKTRRAPISKNKLSRPRTSASDGPSPFDSASQRRVSRDSGSISSALSMLSSPAPSVMGANPSGAVSRFSTSTASTDAPSPFDSSSEPSTGITTPSAEEPGKVELGSSPSVSQQRTEFPLPMPTSGPKKGCTHREMTITNGSDLVCTVCGSWGLKSVFVCTDTVEKREKCRARQSFDGTARVSPSKPARKQEEEQASSRLDLPFVKSMTQQELAKYSTEELMKMIIEHNPEYAESRCQLHSAITAVRSAVAQRTSPTKANHIRESTELTSSSISSTLSWLPGSNKQRCQYSVCAECASKDVDREYPGLESVTKDKAQAASAVSQELPRQRWSPSFAAGQPRKISRKTAEIRWSEGGPMVSLWDLDVFYHGLAGNGWRVPKWTRPRNMLRTPRRLKDGTREDSTSVSSSPRPTPRGRSVSHAEAHGVWD